MHWRAAESRPGRAARGYSPQERALRRGDGPSPCAGRPPALLFPLPAAPRSFCFKRAAVPHPTFLCPMDLNRWHLAKTHWKMKAKHICWGVFMDS